MVDNVAITAGTGTTIAADDIGAGVLAQRVKLVLGVDGTGIDAVAGAGVVGTGVQRVTLASDDPAVTALNAALPAGANIIGKVGIDQTTPGTTNAIALSTLGATAVAVNSGVVGNGVLRTVLATDVALPAGENYIGKTGADVYVTQVTPTVSSSPAYSTGDCIGSKMTFATMARTSGGGGVIQAAKIYCKSLQTFACDLLIFNADPTASTFTDNAALAVNSADINKLVAVLHISDWTALGAAVSMAQFLNAGAPFDLSSGTTLYAVLVARSTPTLSTTSDITVELNVIPG